jgi:hypothetical protein
VLAVELSLQGVSAGVPIIAIDDHKFGDEREAPGAHRHVPGQVADLVRRLQSMLDLQ